MTTPGKFPPSSAGRAPSERPLIQLVVVDFDDTLYDWIGHFVPALEAMITAATGILPTTTENLREELKAVHEHYGNTEQPFALLETASARSLLGDLPRADQRRVLAPAFAAFDAVRAEKLALYDDVLPALSVLREIGLPVVGYSAATTVNIAKRIRMLDLAPLLDTVYASPFAGLPYPGERRSQDEGFQVIELANPKPDPEVIHVLTSAYSVTPSGMLFVGDSIASDIAPAVQGGSNAALVRRDAAATAKWLPDLLRVSHRTAESRADSLSLSDATLSAVPVIRTLPELWEHFTFVPLASDKQ